MIDGGFQAHADFIGLYKIDNTKAFSSAESIKDVVVGLNLSISKFIFLLLKSLFKFCIFLTS
jgi:hypothetical protein